MNLPSVCLDVQKAFLFAFCCDESLIWGCLIVCTNLANQCLESCVQPTIRTLNILKPYCWWLSSTWNVWNLNSWRNEINCRTQLLISYPSRRSRTPIPCEMTPAHDDSQMLILLCALTCFIRALAECSDTQVFLGMVWDLIQAPLSPPRKVKVFW